MKKIWIILLAGLLTLSACVPVQPATSTGPGVGTIVASTLQAMTAAAPPATAEPPTQAPPSGTAVSFQNVSFVIPTGLALGANGEAVPVITEDNGAPWDAAPAHIHFTFFGYNDVLAKFSTMEISVYPAQEYAAVSNGAGNSIPRLQAILASPSAPIDVKNLPNVPYFNAGAMMTAQVKVINFASGSGVRSVTQYGQAVGAVMNNGTFYHFEGLTADGKYYIVAVLPIGSPILQSGSDPYGPLPAGGVQFPQYTTADPADYETYFQAVTDALNAASPDSFQPSLSMLDALVQSITIAP
jgi:hypothetical protein